jgi:glycosyltransferase involved in cell wall biosynthesis
VPSEFVRRSVLELGADPKRIATVPYGLDEQWLDQVNEPVPGRVLFVGSVGLRKGSHYLAQASRILERRHVPCEVRVVGPYRPDAVSHPAFTGPTYVGQVPRSRVMDEFRRADVFVLPTLCEGMATVHLEAMACGVPVVTTPNCGSVVRDGVDGFIVPIRDAAAIADKVELLLADRALRERMGASARQRAKEFTWARYGERLISALGTLAS